MIHRRPLLAALSALLVVSPVAACGAVPVFGYVEYESETFTVDLPVDWYDEGELDTEWTGSNQRALMTGVIRPPEGDLLVHVIWAISDVRKNALEWTVEEETETAEVAGSYERVSLEGRESASWFGPDRSTALLEFEAVLEPGEPHWGPVDVEDPHRLVLQKIVKEEGTDVVHGIRVSLPAAEAQEHRDTAERIADSFDMHVVDVSDV
ncbi:hypothetical protein [Nocardiopsis sp. CC223A]|uniref:hypothetical protein n=1 Tax=Nocardiopsis sp. CC223A TaxID=3044051 RepID=UPI00278BCCF7|nr:hypothetical protein [Nocardiopsis sp. CC223A]